MPRYNYDPENYDDDEPVFEPNRVRKTEKFKKERENPPEEEKREK